MTHDVYDCISDNRGRRRPHNQGNLSYSFQTVGSFTSPLNSLIQLSQHDHTKPWMVVLPGSESGESTQQI